MLIFIYFIAAWKFYIQVHNSRACDGSVYSCPRALSLFFPNEQEIHISGYQVHQGGRRCVCCKNVISNEADSFRGDQ